MFLKSLRTTVLVERTELGFETSVYESPFFLSILSMGILQPVKTKNEPNRHSGTLSSLICIKNKLKQEIDFIKTILLKMGTLKI